MKAPTRPVDIVNHKLLPIQLVDSIARKGRDILSRSAILQKLAMVSAESDQGGVDEKLDADLWRGVEDLMRQNRRDMQALIDMVDRADEGEQ